MDMEQRDNKAHVLLLPFPAQGHITPFLQFSKRLIHRGIKATLANNIFISRIMHVDPSSSINVDTISDGCDDSGYAQAESDEAYMTKLQVIGSQTLTHLIKKLSACGPKINTLIYDATLPWGLGTRCGKAIWANCGSVLHTGLCYQQHILPSA